MLIGLLRRYRTPLTKDFVAALVAKENNADAIFFTPQDIDFDHEVIRGQCLKGGEWIRCISYFPDVVYNDVPNREDIEIYDRLESKGIPFTTHRFGINKVVFQTKMAQDEMLSKHTIQTVPYDDFQTFAHFIEKHGEVVLKPNRGHKGLGIAVIKKTGENVDFQDFSGKRDIISQRELENHFSQIQDLKYHHIQAYVNCITKNGTPYVIRSYVGRNKNGNWMNFFQYAASSLNGNPIVNVSVGSGMSYIEPFLNDNYGDKAGEILIKIKGLSIRVAECVQNYVRHKIDAIGIDYGFSDNGDAYIFEVNAFPGTRPFEALVERHAVPYAIYLGKVKKWKVTAITNIYEFDVLYN